MEKDSKKDRFDDQEPKKEIGAFGGYLVGKLPFQRRLKV